MKFSEVLEYYDYKTKKIAEALGISRLTVYKWKNKNAIPFDKQCQIEVTTNGKLRASKEKDAT